MHESALVQARMITGQTDRSGQRWTDLETYLCSSASHVRQLTCVISAEPTQMTTTAKIKSSPNRYFHDAPLCVEPAAVIAGASPGLTSSVHRDASSKEMQSGVSLRLRFSELHERE